MNFIFHPEAKQELAHGVAYYESCQAGLGSEFLEEVYSTIQRIIEFPKAWAALSENSRRCIISRFPYGIIYQILADDSIRIIAVMQLNKEPDYWTVRL